MSDRALTPAMAWTKYDEIEARLTAPVSARMVELADLRPNMRVLDLATGRGEPALSAAAGVGPGGTVLGVDSDPDVLALARSRAQRMGISNLELSATSAESLDALPSGTFDAVLCRWGLMYMAAPARALAHARRLLQPARPLVVAVWALPSPWATLPQQVFAQQGIVAPAPLRALRYEEPAVLDAELRAAGFAIGHSVEMTTAVMEAETGAEVATWYHDLGFLRALDPLSPPRRALAESMLAAEAEGLRAGRSIQLLGTTRIVVALAPG